MGKDREDLITSLEFLKEIHKDFDTDLKVYQGAYTYTKLGSIGIAALGIYATGGLGLAFWYGAGFYAACLGAQKATTGRAPIIPFMNKTLGDVYNDFVTPAEYSPEDDAEDCRHLNLVGNDDQLSYMLSGDWAPVALRYLPPEASYKEMAREYRKLIRMALKVRGLRRFVKSPRRASAEHKSFRNFQLAVIEKVDQQLEACDYQQFLLLPPSETPERVNEDIQPIATEVVSHPTQNLKPAIVDSDPKPQPIKGLPQESKPKQQTQTKPIANTKSAQADDLVNLAKSLATNPSSTLILGKMRSGKGFTVAHAIRIMKEQIPNLTVWFIDPKADPNEGYLDGVADNIFCSSVEDASTVFDHETGANTGLIDWVSDCLDFVGAFVKSKKGFDTPKLLIIDEMLMVNTHMEADKQCKALWGKVKAMAVGVCVGGPSFRAWCWFMSQSGNVADFGVTGGTLGTFRRVALVNLEPSNDPLKRPDNSLIAQSASLVFFDKVKCPDKLSRSNQRVAYDSAQIANKWVMTAPLPPLANPNPIRSTSEKVEPNNQKQIIQEVLTPEPIADILVQDDKDPVEEALLAFIDWCKDQTVGKEIYISNAKQKIKEVRSLTDDQYIKFIRLAPHNTDHVADWKSNKMFQIL